jgi:hypothetical protein
VGTADQTMFKNYHNNRTFSTYDYGVSKQCSVNSYGGWWIWGCFTANLNGNYSYEANVTNAGGIHWRPNVELLESCRATEMKFRNKV